MTASNFDDNARYILGRQYMQPGETSIEEVFARAAGLVRSVPGYESLEKPIYDLMVSKKFCPGGRILAGAGTQHQQTSNCFVYSSDSEKYETLEDMLNVALKLALTSKVGGGVGVNLDPFSSKAKATPQRSGRGNVAIAIRDDHPDADNLLKWGYNDVTRSGQQGERVSPPRRAVDDVATASEIKNEPWRHQIEVEDSLESIIRSAFDTILSVSSGNDALIDLSALRAEGSAIKGSGGSSSGPASFAIEIFDNFLHWYDLGGCTAGPVAALRYVFAPILRVVRQGGTRRGAGMATLSVEHPDVLDFLTCKDLDREQAEGDISTFNISLLASNNFMSHAIEHDLGERQLLQRIAEHAHATGEPGLIFVDTINEHNPLLPIDGPIKSTNP